MGDLQIGFERKKNTMVITQEPKAGQLAQSPNGEFKNGLCGFNCGSCMKSWCCPCLVGRDVGEAMEGNGGVCCLAYLASMFIGILPCLVCYQRGKLRQAKAIEGSDVSDFCVSCFCMCCVLCQMDQEIKEEA